MVIKSHTRPGTDETMNQANKVIPDLPVFPALRPGISGTTFVAMTDEGFYLSSIATCG